VSRRLGGALLALAVALLLGAGAWLLLRDRKTIDGTPAAPAVTAIPAPVGGGVSLFFPGGDGRLHRETRDVALDGDVTERTRQVVTALLEGPRTAELLPLLPAGTELLRVLAGPPGVVYLDLRAPSDPQALAMGSRQELVTVYGLVDRVVLNVPGLTAVGFLWSGAQPLSFAGHVDTTAPLAADTSLVSETTAEAGG
jgi:hypothetical protein